MVLRGNYFSNTLMMNTGITIVTPMDISSATPHQVCYLIHGMGSNNSDICDFTMLPYYANNYNCIMVIPEIYQSFGTDMVYGQPYFTYLTKELPIACKNIFNISSSKNDTFIIGLSSSGYTALRAAFTFPEKYAACCGISSGNLYPKYMLDQMKAHSTEPDFIKNWGQQFISDYAAAFGTDFTWSPDIDPLELAKKIYVSASPKIYMCCGSSDGLASMNKEFSDDLKKLNIPTTYEEWEGNHEWNFFNTAIKKSLDFCTNLSK